VADGGAAPLRAVGDDDLVAGELEDDAGQLGVHPVVLDDQHAERHRGLRSTAPTSATRASGPSELLAMIFSTSSLSCARAAALSSCAVTRRIGTERVRASARSAATTSTPAMSGTS